ncbi:MAG: ABC transporter permease [Rhodospirillales bacterium]|nr:ABC transporter permease [Rhodospirillales bacterium]
MLKIEQRTEPSKVMLYATPLLALILTILSGFFLFTLMGKDPLQATKMFFFEPLTSFYNISELMVKAAPLILIGLGLSAGFKAGVWNIGAEGQFTIGAIAGSAVALYFYEMEGFYILPLMCLAGMLGGMAWAAIPALLRTRFNTNEILVSLMLVYVSTLLLNVLVHGPMKDPEGMNFPQSRLFSDSALLPLLMEDGRAHIGFVVALIFVGIAWVIQERHIIGFQIKVSGQADGAAKYAGFSSKKLVWMTFLFSGGLAGLAGIFEAAGPVGQLVPALPVGYGFTAIIVAFLGRLNPVGILLGGLLMALTYIGGENAQISLNLPSATTSVFQGLLLFFLLATDILINYQIKWLSVAKPSVKSN